MKNVIGAIGLSLTMVLGGASSLLADGPDTAVQTNKNDPFAGLGQPLAMEKEPDKYRAFGDGVGLEGIDALESAAAIDGNFINSPMSATGEAMSLTITPHVPMSANAETRTFGVIPAQAVGTRGYANR